MIFFQLFMSCRQQVLLCFPVFIPYNVISFFILTSFLLVQKQLYIWCNAIGPTIRCVFKYVYGIIDGRPYIFPLWYYTINIYIYIFYINVRSHNHITDPVSSHFLDVLILSAHIYWDHETRNADFAGLLDAVTQMLLGKTMGRCAAGRFIYLFWYI